MSTSSPLVERVVDCDSEGRTNTHFGVPICKGPGMYRMMLTWPASDEGRIVEIPRARIREISPAQAASRGEMPRVLVNAGI